MKTNRRGFFGLSAGALLAGPSAAKGLANSGSGLGYGMSLPSAGFGAVEKEVPDDGEWKIKHIVRLVRKVNGKRTEEEEAERALYSNDDFTRRAMLEQIDGLKSVSATYKNRMAHAAVRREADANERRHAAHELLHHFKIPQALWKDYE